ncbi:uncharacterized protein LOC126842617, partial [Adelges cooleyi]|uniref:uncharacterized protein LOC126842617 n=1 Tax=Adelges cooleyi TaxID=133065 RepID=UPI00217F31B2
CFRGQKCISANFYTTFLAGFIGLVSVLSIPTILEVLVHTNKSSEPYTAYRRYSDTIRHVLGWYKYDLKDMESKSQKALSIVSGLHCAAAKSSSKFGLRITQKDMALTQFGFMGLILLKKKELAIVCTDEDEMGIVHMWRTLGHLLGIHEEYNLCRGSLEEVRSLCAAVMTDVYVPCLKNPPSQFNHMVGALLDGMKPLSFLIDLEAFMKFISRIYGLPEQRLTNSHSRWIFNIQMFISGVLLTKWWLAWLFRPIMNYQLRISVWLNDNFPLAAALKFGTKVFFKVPYLTSEAKNHFN